MTYGVGQRFLCDADDLALDPVAQTWNLVHRQIDGHRRGPAADFSEPLESRGDVLTAADVRAKRPDRAACFGQMHPRQVDGGLDAGGNRWRQRARFALGALKLHQDRGKALREVVVNVPREAVAL